MSSIFACCTLSSIWNANPYAISRAIGGWRVSENVVVPPNSVGWEAPAKNRSAATENPMQCPPFIEPLARSIHAFDGGVSAHVSEAGCEPHTASPNRRLISGTPRFGWPSP